jgi:hypothetical protein
MKAVAAGAAGLASRKSALVRFEISSSLRLFIFVVVFEGRSPLSGFESAVLCLAESTSPRAAKTAAHKE